MNIKEKLKRMSERCSSRQRQATFDEQGRLICDPNPLKYPVGFKKPPSKEESLRNILKAHQDQMTFNSRYEDETDFDINEVDMLSPYQQHSKVFELEEEFHAPTPTQTEGGEGPPNEPTGSQGSGASAPDAKQ